MVSAWEAALIRAFGRMDDETASGLGVFSPGDIPRYTDALVPNPKQITGIR